MKISHLHEGKLKEWYFKEIEILNPKITSRESYIDYFSKKYCCKIEVILGHLQGLGWKETEKYRYDKVYVTQKGEIIYDFTRLLKGR